MNLQELLAQREALDAQLARHRDEALHDARVLVELYHFTTVELGIVKTQHLAPARNGATTFPQKTARQPAPPKYRDPATGQTWSGRGKAPHWIQDHERDEFLIP